MKLECGYFKFLQNKIFFIFDDSIRYIEYDGNTYKDLDSFLQAYPEVMSYLDVLARITNFIFGGMQYTLIENIPIYQEKYQKKFQEEMKSNEYQITQYGHFDISQIVPPQLKGNIFTYFVESVSFGIPYQVTCMFSEVTTCTYTLLPRS